MLQRKSKSLAKATNTVLFLLIPTLASFPFLSVPPYSGFSFSTVNRHINKACSDEPIVCFRIGLLHVTSAHYCLPLGNLLFFFSCFSLSQVAYEAVISAKLPTFPFLTGQKCCVTHRFVNICLFTPTQPIDGRAHIAAVEITQLRLKF